MITNNGFLEGYRIILPNKRSKLYENQNDILEAIDNNNLVWKEIMIVPNNDYMMLDIDKYNDSAVSDDDVVIGCVNFILLGQSCPKNVIYEDWEYEFKCVTIIPSQLTGIVCSAIIYKLK